MRRISKSNLVQLVNAERRKACIQLGVFAAIFATTPTIHAVNNRRLVSIGGALTEIVFALGANADLVGVDTTSLYPESAHKLPNVGYARSLSVEGILALAPTHVIVVEDAGPPTVLQQLRALGIPVTVLASNHRFEGLIERVQQVGDLSGRISQAAAMQHALQQEWAKAHLQIKAKSVRVLFVLAHAPNQIMVAGSETSAQAMLQYVGATNAINGFSGYKPITPEAVIAAQPDIVLLTDQGLKAAGGGDNILRLPGIMQTPAGRNRRVISFEAVFLLGFGPRFPSAVSALNTAIEKVMRK